MGMPNCQLKRSIIRKGDYNFGTFRKGITDLFHVMEGVKYRIFLWLKSFESYSSVNLHCLTNYNIACVIIDLSFGSSIF